MELEIELLDSMLSFSWEEFNIQKAYYDNYMDQLIVVEEQEERILKERSLYQSKLDGFTSGFAGKHSVLNRYQDKIDALNEELAKVEDTIKGLKILLIYWDGTRNYTYVKIRSLQKKRGKAKVNEFIKHNPWVKEQN